MLATLALKQGWHARSLTLWSPGGPIMTASQCEFDRHIDMPSTSCDSSCELDRHIGMLSSSCVSEIELNMHITFKASLACTLFNTVESGWTHHDSITVWVRQTHRHAIFILWLKLWVGQTHRHAIFILCLWNWVQHAHHIWRRAAMHAL